MKDPTSWYWLSMLLRSPDLWDSKSALARGDQRQPGRQCQRRAASQSQATVGQTNGVGQENFGYEGKEAS